MARLHIPVPEKVLPWQVTVSAVALFIGAVNCLVVALAAVSQMGDRLGIAASLAAGETRNGATVTAVVNHFYISMTVFSIIGVVYLVLGLLLWRGEHRHGVRMIGTIMALVNLIGLIGVIVTAGADGLPTSTLMADLLVQIIILVGMIMLWEGGGRRWEHKGA